MAPSVDISSCNSVKSGGPTSISQHNPQQFQIWNRTKKLVWSGHEESLGTLTCLASVAVAAGGGGGGGLIMAVNYAQRQNSFKALVSFGNRNTRTKTKWQVFGNFDAGRSMLQLHFGFEEAHSVGTNLKQSPPV